jgi:hypothetical protein
MEFRMNEVMKNPFYGSRGSRGENIDEKLRKSSRRNGTNPANEQKPFLFRALCHTNLAFQAIRGLFCFGFAEGRVI